MRLPSSTKNSLTSWLIAMAVRSIAMIWRIPLPPFVETQLTISRNVITCKPGYFVVYSRVLFPPLFGYNLRTYALPDRRLSPDSQAVRRYDESPTHDWRASNCFSPSSNRSPCRFSIDDGDTGDVKPLRTQNTLHLPLHSRTRSIRRWDNGGSRSLTKCMRLWVGAFLPLPTERLSFGSLLLRLTLV